MAHPSITEKTTCHCNLVAVVKTCGKDPNKGREFYTCTKKAARCQFFQWIDDTPLRGQSSYAPNASNASNASNSSMSCYTCGQSGHFSSQCSKNKGKRKRT